MNMEWLEQLLGEEWSLIPAGGATGDAYIAQNGQQKLFLKRNTSPFLAVLSAEGIVPKLLWTRRVTNGDVISAQKWLPGQKLEPEDMKLECVAKLLKKIHSSKALVQMIQRLGKQPLYAQELLQQLYFVLRGDLRTDETIQTGLRYLKATLKDVEYDEFVVCHCDVNHNNWLLSDEDELFLIDWDGALIADPALDLGMLLYWYVPRHEWDEWLAYYGIEMNESLVHRMKWYVVAQTILSVQWHTTKKQQAEAEYWYQYLQQLLASE
ncbi:MULTISPECIES: phosphotransferase family protein [Bacillus]|uniref:phosphotransferase family protein n=1 Tax=Bacillus TaxID=1386 RepID=UPI00039DEDBC|nr:MULTISPECIES: phosphotransferase family protein [Bacillus]PGS09961.1 phosphotransferase [Bacillus pseudomycoides]